MDTAALTLTNLSQWLQSQDLIPILLSYITPQHSAATQASAGDFLKAIITISANATGQDASVIGPNELTRQLVSEPCVQNLVREMLKGGSPLTVGVGIIIEVIRKNNSDYDTEAQIGPIPQSSDPIYLGTLLRMFSKHITDFMDLILSPKHTVVTGKGSETIPRRDLKVAWGEKIEPLGFDRFKTCELMAELLHCSNMTLLNEPGSDAEIKRRDAERERLKTEGKLASDRRPSAVDFGTSVDSSGFHHTEIYAPLGESPENIKSLEAQNNGEEEEFERVTMPEAMGGLEDIPEDTATTPADVKEVVEKLDDVHVSDGSPATKSTGDSSKHPVSLLTQQIQLHAESGYIGDASSGTSFDPVEGNPEDTPPPLFGNKSSKRAASEPSDVRAQDESDVANIDMSETELSTTADTPQTGLSDSQPRGSSAGSEEDGRPVVGDLLKMMFVEHRVVPTILVRQIWFLSHAPGY